MTSRPLEDRYGFLQHLSRGVGHTFAACASGDRVDRLLITFDQREADRLRREYGERNAVSLGRANDAVMGSRKPVVMDIEAVRVMQQDYQNEVDRLRHQLQRIQRIAEER